MESFHGEIIHIFLSIIVGARSPEGFFTIYHIRVV